MLNYSPERSQFLICLLSGSRSKLEFAKDVAPDSFATGVNWLLERTVGTGSTRVSFGPHSFSDLDFANDT